MSTASEPLHDLALREPGQRTIVGAEVEATTTLLRWDDASSSRMHHVWLRDNCGCAECRHPVAGERLADPAAIELTIRPAAARVEGNSLVLQWADGHVTTFSSGWLDTHDYEPNRLRDRRARRRTWTAPDVSANPPIADGPAIMDSDEALHEWMRQLARDGFTIVRGLPPVPGAGAQLAQRIAPLRNSNFGLVWDVRSEPAPDSLAYTAVKLTAHTDLVSREAQPGVQFLHCLVNDAAGGASILVDGFAVAEALRRRAPEHWAVLTRVPATFRYQRDDTDVSATFPVIRLDHLGQYFEIRYSNALMAPLAASHDDVLPFYAAYQAFTALLREREFEFEFRLEPGDCEVFDNRRVLHGRAEFDPTSGPRHLEGCYLDTDDFMSRLRVLDRHGDFRRR